MSQIFRQTYRFSIVKEPVQQLNIQKKLNTRSIENLEGTLAFAQFLPREWNEQQIQLALDPERRVIQEVRIVRDCLSRSTGRALLELKSSMDCDKLCVKFTEGLVDTKDTLQKIVVKPFWLKQNATKSVIMRKLKQAYVTGLPRDMQAEELLELLLDFGEIDNIQIPRDTDQKRNKGYAFILFKKSEDSIRFQQFMTGKQFMGNKLRVQLQIFQFDSQKKSFMNKSDRIFNSQQYQRYTNYDESLKNLNKLQEYININ